MNRLGDMTKELYCILTQLHCCQASQLGRELGINRPPAITEYVKTLEPDAEPEQKERLLRNLERTWLCTFIAETSFGAATGRTIHTTWKELPRCSCQWWRKSATTPLDRMVSGIIETQVQLVRDLHVRKMLAFRQSC